MVAGDRADIEERHRDAAVGVLCHEAFVAEHDVVALTA